MSFDLGDCTKWEFMFPQTEQPQLLVPEQEGLEDLGEDDVRVLDFNYLLVVLTCLKTFLCLNQYSYSPHHLDRLFTDLESPLPLCRQNYPKDG